jgi:TonB-linked SusC/RagA family outer membrane protein
MLILCLIGLQSVFAQSREVSGVVTSADDGMSIPGVSVMVKGTTIGTSTDFDGKYTISVPADGKILIFSSVGMKKTEVEITSNTINLVMESESIGVDEVIVTAVGVKREKKSLGYAVSTVQGSDISKSQSNPVSALAGKVAGVVVSASSGEVGGSNRVVIRGVSSLGGANQPLYIVDGVPILNDMFSGKGDGSIAGVDNGNRASDINPDDIASLTVLKSGAAAALYGSRAKNGVIVITTKRGKQSKKKSYFTYSNSMSIGNPLKLPDYQNTYAPGDKGKYGKTRLNGWGPRISDLEGTEVELLNGDMQELSAHKDNVKDFFDTSFNMSNSIAVADADKDGDYRLSFTNTKNEGLIPESWQKKNVLSFNGGRNMGKVTSRISFSYIRDITNNRGKGGTADAVLGIPRTLDLDYYKDYLNEDGSQKTLSEFSNNPYWSLNKNKYETKMNRVIGNFQLAYKPLEWLEISARIGTDFYNEQRSNITAKGTLGAMKGSRSENNYWSRSFNSDILLTANKEIASDLNLTVILGHNINQRDYRRQSVEAEDFIVDDFYGYANSNKSQPTSYESKRRIWGVFADVTLDYKGYLFLNMTGRMDNSSTLPEENNRYYYPSVSTSFIVTDAFPSLKNNVLSYLKVRANIASVGSDEDPYQLDFNYTALEDVFVQFASRNTYPHGGYRAYSAPGTLPPLSLKPEKQISWETGLDVYLFENRVGLDLSYYETITKDQIIGIQVPNSTGYYRKKLNIAEIKNNGYELRMTAIPFRSDDFKWDMAVNFTKNTTKVVELAPGVKTYDVGSAYNGVVVKAEAGESLALYGKKFERDPEGNMIINKTTGLFAIGGESEKLGDIDPDFTFGFENTFKYKNLSVSALIDGRVGGYMYSNTVRSLRYDGLVEETTNNRGGSIINKGVNEVTSGDETTYVANTTAVNTMHEWWNNYANDQVAESSVFENTWVKLRQVRLDYTFPKKFLANTPFGSAEFGIYGRNLLILYSKVPHIDPEQSALGASSNGQGVEWGGIPTTRNFGVNFRLTF